MKESSWNHRTTTLYRSENKRNFRTSCTSSRRRDISHVIAIWIGWKVVVRFHEMPSKSAQCPKPLGRREILIWTKIWGNHSKDQWIIWRIDWTSPKTPRERQCTNSSIGKKLLRGIFVGYASFAGGNLGKGYSDYWCWRIGNFWRHQKYMSEDWTRKKFW